MRSILRRLVPRRLLPLARRIRERRYQIVQVVLGAGLATGLVFALATAIVAGSRLVALIMLAAVLAAAGLVFWRLYRTHQALRRAHHELGAAAGDWLLQSADGDDPAALAALPPHLAGAAVAAMVERGDVLDAYALLCRLESWPHIGLPTLIQLWDGLYVRGYRGAALRVAKTCAARAGGRRYRKRAELLEAEYRVLTRGLGEPELPARPEGFSPVPGRVLHLVRASMPGTQNGYTIRTHYTAAAQAKAGLVPHVVTPLGHGASGPQRRRTTVDGVTYHRLYGPARESMPLDRWLARNINRVARIVAEMRPAVLHAATDYINALTARALGDVFGLPVVYETRGFWEETWLSRQAQVYGWDLPRLATVHGLPDAYVLRRELEDRCRREADRVVTLAGVMADRIEAGGVARDRIHVVPNAVDVEFFRARPRDDRLAAQLGIADGAVVIGYISSLVEYEGIDTLIEAYAAVRAAAGDERLALLIVGDGPERERLRKLATELGLSGAIFTGRVPHERVVDYYSLIDIFVIPRRPVEVCHLVTPLKPFEAFATGRTVVMSDVRALAEIAKESGAAELFAAGDSQPLATVLGSLLRDETRRKALAAAGVEWVRANRTWAANARRYAQLYAELGAL